MVGGSPWYDYSHNVASLLLGVVQRRAGQAGTNVKGNHSHRRVAGDYEKGVSVVGAGQAGTTQESLIPLFVKLVHGIRHGYQTITPMKKK